MAHQDNEEVCSDSEVDFTFDELRSAFEELMHDYKLVLSENKKLKKHANSFSLENNSLLNDVSSLKTKLDVLEKKNNALAMENEIFKRPKQIVSNNELLKKNKDLELENAKHKNKLEKIKPFVDKFTYSSEKLNLLLNNQRAVFNKAGLGYKPQKQQKYFKNFFVPASSSITCFTCKKSGHNHINVVLEKLCLLVKCGFQKEPF